VLKECLGFDSYASRCNWHEEHSYGGVLLQSSNTCSKTRNFNDIFEEPITIGRDGTVNVLQRLGLGVELREDLKVKN